MCALHDLPCCFSNIRRISSMLSNAEFFYTGRYKKKKKKKEKENEWIEKKRKKERKKRKERKGKERKGKEEIKEKNISKPRTNAKNNKIQVDNSGMILMPLRIIFNFF